MRIAIDGRDLFVAKTGTRTYLEEILKALPRVAPEHDFIVIEPAEFSFVSQKSLFAKIRNHMNFIWWKEVVLPYRAWKNNCSLIFCTDYVVPFFSTVPTVPVFHDANFWSSPEQYNRLWRFLMDWVMLPAAHRAAAVVTVSEFAKREISFYTNISSDRIVVIPNAPKSATSTRLPRSEIESVLRKYKINTTVPYILHVGVLEKRKNLVRLVRAFEHFSLNIEIPYQLILVGQQGPKTDMDDSQNILATVKALQLDSQVILTGHVPDNELPAFYQGATFFAFPSLREGFGIPPLEAFVNSLPVAAANSSALPEVLGDSALFFDPTDVRDIANTLLRLARDQSLRHELIRRGEERLRHYSWDTTASHLVRLFEEIEHEKYACHS